MKRRRKTIPRWQGIMAIFIMYTALFEAGWLLYENAKGPTTIEKEEGTCVHIQKSSYCCDDNPWATMTDQSNNRSYKVSNCWKYDLIE